MPGMMDTVLNLGLNDEAVRGLAEAGLAVPPAIAVELQSGLERGVSTDTNSRSCQTDTSCCEAGQAKSTICSGFSGSAPTMDWKPP